MLHYVFTDKKNKIELIYSGPFYSSKEKDLLWFTNGKARYGISADKIAVWASKTRLDMKADPSSIKGTFPEMQATKFENVVDR